jgi:phosphoribosylamine--glycine ligase
MAELAEVVALPTHEDIASFVASQQIDLVIPGPEQYLVEGLGDRLKALPCRFFGPDRKAAQLEGSKRFAKDLMRDVGVPTAAYSVFDDWEKAQHAVRSFALPLAIKADGLAAGKGVRLCHSHQEVQEALDDMMVQQLYGAAGTQVVIEEFLEGVEASFHVICDGTHALPLVSAQDHKALRDGNQGPNTGGMGTFAPSPWVSDALTEQVMEEIVHPVLSVMSDRGMPFVGCLFVGLMLTDEGPKVLEFNVRFGDPETQVMLPLLAEDLLPILFRAAGGQLGRLQKRISLHQRHAVCVVMAAPGYPEKPLLNLPLQVPDPADRDVLVFHAGTKIGENQQLFSAGGRVLGITSVADDLAMARQNAYNFVGNIQFEGAQFRTDIGGNNVD